MEPIPLSHKFLKKKKKVPSLTHHVLTYPLAAPEVHCPKVSTHYESFHHVVAASLDHCLPPFKNDEL